MFSSVIGAAKVRPVGQDGNIDEGADEGNGRQDHRSCSHTFSTIISATTLAGNQRCSDKNQDGPYDHPGERENRHNYVNDLDEHCLETRRSNEVILVESTQENEVCFSLSDDHRASWSDEAAITLGKVRAGRRKKLEFEETYCKCRRRSASA